MDDPDRRRLLASLGSVAAGTALAGCSGGPLSDGGNGDGSDGTPTGTPSPTTQDRFVTDDGRVDYPGMVDGAATVNADGDAYTIEYESPSREFRLDSAFEGERNPAELRVSRDMTIDARAGFIAPVYDDGSGNFVFQLFANQAFVDHADWNYVTYDSNQDPGPSGSIPFERIEGDVYAAALSPGDVDRLFMVDVTAEEIRDASGISGVVLLTGDGDQTPAPSVPQAQFSFEYDGAAGELTVTHDGGDNIPEEDDLFVATSDTAESWVTPVAAGDSKTVEVESDVTVRIVWRSESGDRTSTLAEWVGPDA